MSIDGGARHCEVGEQAAPYALRVLSPEEQARFEAHLAGGCSVCEHEVRASEATIGLVGAAAPAVAPPPSLRDRLLAAVAREDDAWVIVRTGETTWERGAADGVWVKLLFQDPVDGRRTVLERVDPGAEYPAHRHAGHEELYVIAGDLDLDGRTLGPGDYCAAMDGSVHGRARTAHGCTLLRTTGDGEQRAEGGDGGGIVFSDAASGDWHELEAPGVSMRRLFREPRHGAITALVRMRPGARLPGHRHVTAEQFYMIEGDAHVGGQVQLLAGDFYRAPRATTHAVSHTEHGCTFLLIASRLELLALSGQ